MSTRLLKICCSEWKNESRDKRELSLCKELGMDVVVLAKKQLYSKNHEIVAGFNVVRLSTRPFGNILPNFLNRFISLIKWANYARRFNADIISGHDIEGLAIAYLSNVFKKNKAKLVYDSHEFELGNQRNTGKNFRSFIMKLLEGFLMRKCSFSIMVSDGIAQEVKKIHNFNGKIVVVRNIPEKWILNQKEINNKRNEICNKIGIDTNAFLIMYHGAFFPYRGIENMLKAMQQIKGIGCILLGDGDKKYIEQISLLCNKLSITERVLICKSVDISELYLYVSAVNVSLIIVEPVTKSFYYSLPNKLFENIQSLTPLIVSNFSEMKKLVNNYNIGLTVDPMNINEIVNAIQILMNDIDFYEKIKKNLILAKEELCWENEKNILLEAYRELL